LQISKILIALIRIEEIIYADLRHLPQVAPLPQNAMVKNPAILVERQTKYVIQTAIAYLAKKRVNLVQL
jgi:hypothetical protein